MNKLKRNLIAIAFSVAIISSVLSLSAYISDLDHQSYVYETDSVKIEIIEAYNTDDVIIHNGDPLSYNCTVQNNGASSCYLFVEFDSPMINSQPIFEPVAASDWELYKEDSVNIESVTYHRYIFSYSNGTEMTELKSGESTDSVFTSINMAEMTESLYAAIEDKTFHVVARAVMVGEGNSDVDTAWDQVPGGY